MLDCSEEIMMKLDQFGHADPFLCLLPSSFAHAVVSEYVPHEYYMCTHLRLAHLSEQVAHDLIDRAAEPFGFEARGDEGRAGVTATESQPLSQTV